MIRHSQDEPEDISGSSSTENELGTGGNELGTGGNALGSGGISPEDPTVAMSQTSSSVHAPSMVQIGDYKICRELGRGGMGIVYEATQLSLLRQVALKVLPSAAHLDSMRAKRFENESRAAAQLNHPNIIPVYAVGAADGVSYFAMHLVEGKDFSQLIRGIRRDLADRQPKSRSGRPKSTTLRQVSATINADNPKSRHRSSNTHRSDGEDDPRMELSASDYHSRSGRHSTTYRAATTVARLGIRVADALQHAHDSGIVHRDIKPSNLMLDNNGKVWVTDFGLAQISSSPSMTRTGDMLGTLRYMSPEQATGVRALIDHRTDIYSLGVTLCEILTLERIVKGESNEEVLKEVVYGAPTRVRRIDPGVPDDMATILEKAMSKNPLERYATAGEMAEDLHRFVHNESIKAKRPGVIKRCSQWLGRHRAVATAIASSLAVLLITSLVATAAIAFAWQSEAAQLVKTRKALSVSEGLRMLLNASSVLPQSPGLSQALAAEGATAVPGIEANLTLLAASNANHEYAKTVVRENTSQVAVSSDGAFAVTCAPDSGVNAPAVLHNLVDGSPVREFASGNSVACAIFSPTGKYLMTSNGSKVDGDSSVIFWETGTGAKSSDVSDARLDEPHAGVFSSDGEHAVLCIGDEAVVYDLSAKKRVVALRGHTDSVVHAEFSPDNSMILTVSDDKSIRVWDSTTAREIRPPVTWEADQPAQAHFTAASDHLLVRDQESIRLYTTEAGPDALTPIATAPLLFMEPSRTHHQLALYGIHSIRVLSSIDLEPICEFDLDSETIRRACFHPTQKKLLVTCEKVMYLFDTETGQRLAEFRGHTASVRDAALGARTPVLASVATDRSLRLWHLQSGYEQRDFEAPPTAYKTPHVLSNTNADDTLIAVYPRISYRTSIRNLDGTPAGIEFSGAQVGAPVQCEYLVTVHGRVVIVTEADTSRQVYRGVFAETLSTGLTRMLDRGRHCLVHTQGGQAFLVDLASGSRRLLSEPGAPVTGICVASDLSYFVLTSGTAGRGRYAAIATETGEILWDRTHDQTILHLQLSGDGGRLGLVDATGTAYVWSMGGDWPELASLTSPERPVDRLAFASDGKGLVTWHSRKNEQIRFYEKLENDSFQELPAAGRVAIDVHATLPLVAVGSSKLAAVWNPSNQSVTELVDRGCSQICFATERVALLLAKTESEGAQLQIRAIDDGELEFSEQLELAPGRLGFDEESRRWILTESGYSADVYDYASSEFAFPSPAHPQPIIWAGFSASLNRLVTVSDDGRILVTNDTGKLIHRMDLQNSTATAVALDFRGKALLVGSSSGRLTMWRVADGSQMVQLDGHSGPIRSIRFDETGNLAVVVAEGEPPRLWDLREHQSSEMAIENPLHAEISKQGSHSLVIAGDEGSRPNTAWLVDNTTKQVIEITQKPLGTRAALFSSDGQKYGLLRSDRVLEVYELESRQLLCALPTSRGTYRFAFSPDGQQIQTASSTDYSLWSTETCRKVLEVPSRRGQRILINADWQPFSRNNRWFNTDAYPAKHPRSPVDFAKIFSARELSQDERLLFRIDLAENPVGTSENSE